MRCPEVIVGAVNDVIVKAREIKRLDGRIEKPYRYYEPIKGDDSRQHPLIDLVETTVQRDNANYFGRYIEECIGEITEDEINTAAEKNEPVVLIIGSNPYRRQVEQHLIKTDYFTTPDKASVDARQEALRILQEEPNSNLGWRIILSCGDQRVARAAVRKAEEDNVPLADLIGAKEREKVLGEAKSLARRAAGGDEGEDKVPIVAITSYEGSKGRSAQYVFLLGLHSGDLPRNATDVQDIEICRFLVGLTRTKKKCAILVAKNAMGNFKQRSDFLGWIKPERFATKKVDAAYWR
jgi:hypothetical protein